MLDFSQPVTPELQTLVQEIQKIPPTQWNNLLELLQVFRKTVNPDQPKVNQAAIDLLRSWREEGDEQDQRETWEFLQAALDEDRLSNRPLSPQ